MSNLSKQDDQKREKANALIDSPTVAISVQVINEVCSNLIKKSNFKENQIQQLIQSFYDGCRVVELNQESLMRATYLRTQHYLSFWDGLIVAAALYSNAATLYSEDMQDGLKISNQMEIVNPFK